MPVAFIMKSDHLWFSYTSLHAFWSEINVTYFTGSAQCAVWNCLWLKHHMQVWQRTAYLNGILATLQIYIYLCWSPVVLFYFNISNPSSSHLIYKICSINYVKHINYCFSLMNSSNLFIVITRKMKILKYDILEDTKGSAFKILCRSLFCQTLLLLPLMLL